MIITLRSLPALTLAALATTSTVSAIDAGGIAIHGSLSATGAYSDKYDYYGDTSGSFDFNVKEIAEVRSRTRNMRSPRRTKSKSPRTFKRGCYGLVLMCNVSGVHSPRLTTIPHSEVNAG